MVSKVVWLVCLLGDLGLPISSPVHVFCNSQVAFHIARNPICTKHIKVDCHFVHDVLGSGVISF